MAVTDDALHSISTPERVDSRLGAPEYVEDRVFLNGFPGILRLYSPLQPYFDKTWRPSEIEP